MSKRDRAIAHAGPQRARTFMARRERPRTRGDEHAAPLRGGIRNRRERREAVAITTALAPEHLASKGGMT
jgi:hypothetical protein